MYLPHQRTSNTTDVDLDVFHAATLLNCGNVQTSIARRPSDAPVDAIGIITTSQENIAYLRDKVQAASNQSREAVTGQDYRSLSAADANDCFCDLWTSIAQGKVWKAEIRNCASDGGVVCVDSTVTPFLAEDGSPQYVVIRAEISGREPAEADGKTQNQHLLDQQSHTRALLESDLDALMTIDVGGIITDANSEMELLTGHTRDELIGAPFKHRVTDPARTQTSFNRTRTDATLGNREHSGRASHHALRVVSYNASTSHDRDRVRQGVLAAARDVTEQKCFDDALQQRNIELEVANRMKSDFLTRLSHELRTRLNSIIGFSEALKDGVAGPMSARQQQRVRGIVEIGRHMLSLAQDIHDHSKVEAGKVRLALEAVDLASLCASTMCIIRERAESRCIRLEIDAPVELEPIQADLRMCKQILLNLLANAVNFTHYGGKVTLRVRRVCRAEISRPSGSWAHRGFALADDGFAEFLEISVTDSGIGISADSMNRLFEPFTQIDSGPVRCADGTGLGLANVKLFAELHGGSVAVESALGEGSRFAVWLPLQAAQEDVLASATQMARPPLETLVRPRIARLVKDDLRSAERIGVQLEAVRFSAIASDVVANESGIASG
jgi:PAS domain S-box-containing protein